MPAEIGQLIRHIGSYQRTHKTMTSPGNWRPLNGLRVLIDMEFYPSRMPAPKFATEPLRHSFGTEMLRAGVTLPAVMKLLGHSNPEMTMRYLDVALRDLQREFNLARSQPRHLVPAPRLPASVGQPNVIGLLDSLKVAQHVLEMFRRTLPQVPDRRVLDRLANRLTKIASEARKLERG